jgi:hypothetical protein
MDVCNFVVNQLADQDLGTFINSLRCLKNFPSFGVSPPTTPNGSACDRLCEARDRTTRGLEHDPVMFHESDRFSGIHFNLSENDSKQQTTLCATNDLLGGLQ